MYVAVIVVFVLGYIGIALEHSISKNKTATTLLLRVVCWMLLVFGVEDIYPTIDSIESQHFLSESLLHHIGEIS